VTAPVPLSRSPLWQMQRAYYEREASQAFADIPHQIVDNPFMAAALARVAGGFYRDCARGTLDPSEPLYLVELGAGAGRFAHGFVRELAAWAAAVPLALPPFVYVLTDLGEHTLEDWSANAALEDERLDFARFDVTSDDTLALRRRGIELSRLKNPLVVIANYVFDSVPADAFTVGEGTLEECLVAVSGADVATMELEYSPQPVGEEHYGDPDLDALLAHYRGRLSDTVVTIPRAAIECVRRLRALAGDRLLVLAADKAHSTEEALGFRTEPELRRHGHAFSLMVNFHALGRYARRAGGEALLGGDRQAVIDVGAFLFGESSFAETRLAYAEAVEGFGPEDFSLLTEGIEHAAEELSVAELIAVLRLSRWDAFTLLGIADSLRGSVGDADPAVQEDLRQALYETYDRHFSVPGEGDLPFTIAALLYEMEDYEDALEFFQASLEQHGPHEATRRNIELCERRLEAGE
jgi:hypothetical protein